jgi:hypothetical protein
LFDSVFYFFPWHGVCKSRQPMKKLTYLTVLGVAMLTASLSAAERPTTTLPGNVPVDSAPPAVEPPVVEPPVVDRPVIDRPVIDRPERPTIGEDAGAAAQARAAEARLLRQGIREQQLERSSAIRTANQQERQRLRAEASESRQAFLAERAQMREQLQERIGTLRDELPNHREVIETIKETASEQGKARRGSED